METGHDTRCSCQTYEGGFGACPGAEAHGGYSFCGYATLLLLDRESICDRESLLVRRRKKRKEIADLIDRLSRDGPFNGR